MILADKRDYANGYKKHYSAYKSLSENNSAIKSRRLLLVYCVECGLKYLLLDKWKEPVREILKHKEGIRYGIITSHNLEKMLKELGQAGTFRFPQMETVYKDSVAIDSFHQLCRYCIQIQNSDREKENRYEEELQKLAEWIREGI